jgi:hypothetical protein
MPLTTLHPAGVALLLFTADRTLTVPNVEQDRPGIRCTAYRGRDDVVLMEAVGWSCTTTATDAITRAAQIVRDVGFVVSFPAIELAPHQARLVSRGRK